MVGVALWMTGAAESAAQQVAPPPTAAAVRTSERLQVDGVLDEASWSSAEPITRFTQVDPEEGAPVSEPTTVYLLYDDEALYVGARLDDSRPVSTRLGRRDDYISSSDWFSVSLDSYRDYRTAYLLMVNPSGVRTDATLTDRGPDGSWDPVWEAETTVTDSGWTVEMRIPFSQLRFRPMADQVWGIQIEREIARRQEEAVFSFTPKRERGGIARYGSLRGLRGLRPGDQLEIVPYVVGRAAHGEVESSPDVAFDNPFREESELQTRAGMDLKYRITSNLTLDATVNPDFGQVEADPAEVNLSAFESRFGERRPFFVEGSDIFSFGGGGWGAVNLFYSRRIGGAPQVTGIDGAVYSDVPDNSTILGAAKLTGKTAGGWSIGIMEALTQQEEARFVTADGEIGRVVVEPLSNHVVARARRETREGRSLFGGIFTAVNRRIGDDRVRDAVRSGAYTAGVDFRNEWLDRTWVADGYLIGSHVRGSDRVILDAQMSPARYYQRPDAGHLTIDPTATSLDGYAGRMQLSKQAGEHWRGNVAGTVTSPGFEVNDLGYHYNADRIFIDTELRYVENRPGRLVRSWNVGGGPGVQWNYGGDFVLGSSSLRYRAELMSYWSVQASVRQSIGAYDDRLTRGGPLAWKPALRNYSLGVESDRRKAVSGRLETSYHHDTGGGWSRSLGLGLAIRPAPNWSMSFDPEYSRRYSAAQYVGVTDDPVAAATYGRRYLFAGLSQTTVSMATRLNFVFTPELTLEMFVEPFLASGDYGEVMELSEPGTFDFLTYGRDVGSVQAGDGEYLVDPDADGPAQPFSVRDRDFRRGSLNGNAVLRWEWRPGSTLFLVWQQARAARNSDGDFAFGPGFRDLWSERPNNVLLLKMSYWFSR